MKVSQSLNIDFFIAAIVALIGMIYSHESGVDTTLASYFFNPNKQWLFRNSFILEKILHKGGVLFVIVLLLGIIGRLFYLNKFHYDKKQRDYLGFVFCCSIFTIITVFFLKKWSTLPCPWNSVFFGGEINPPRLLEAFSLGLTKENCFPAAHSSGGFGFLSMYFGYTLIYGKRRIKTLIPGLGLGVIFGVTQQLRGAHYLSHDFATILITIMISWITSLIYSYYNQKYEN